MLLAWELHLRSTQLDEMINWQDFVTTQDFCKSEPKWGGWLNLGASETSMLEKLTFDDL